MENFNIYQDIAQRTNGDIYIGVVGPVRTGKSTFIKRFMDLLVIPNISDSYNKERAKDELPQSAGGKTIMTTEPKFIPNESVTISLNDNLEFNVRMIDCVGYMVPSAIGHLEGENPRMVNTPWYEYEIPFTEAAEIGTKKVINDHSTIGIVVTTDGTITDIPRDDYEEAEQRVINELKEINKPFVVLLNSTKPYDADTQELKEELESNYNVPVIACNCAQLKDDDINKIMESVLYEFPVQEIQFILPKWIEALDKNHWLKNKIISAVKDTIYPIHKLRELKDSIKEFNNYDFIKRVYQEKINLGEGIVKIDLNTEDKLFYQVLSETTGIEIEGEHQLISLIRKLADTKREYDKVSYALHEVKEKGYGVVTPMLDELKLEEPEIVKQGNRFGVKLRASAPSIHLIRADIETEVSPIVGTEKQSEELVSYLMSEFETDPKKIWESNIFGKSLHELVNEGLQNKLYRMPEDAQMKLQETLQKIINEGSGGLICIIL
ncbi:stage IV sporulation protein A [Defluviitalea phaphyphila]|uniref:stage IV sporulation protein A n=1 Tax=Defluviitalea phaphyphila TaxID=1473580 RepID=UPI000730BF7D|nr:stage IV sporulation protein A [Defluviitalea phaphyphila]